MPSDSRYDNPDVINAFLANMRISDEELHEPAANVEKEFCKENAGEITDQGSGSKSTSGVNTPAVVSTASSPRAGTRAPPSTPENPTLRAASIGHLPSIDEGQDEGHEKVDEVEQQKSSPPKFRPTADPFLPSSPAQSIDSILVDCPEGASLFTFVDQLKYDLQVKNYNQFAFKKFREQAEARLAKENSQLNKANGDEHNRSPAEIDTQPCPTTDTNLTSNTRTEGSAVSTGSNDNVKSSSVTTEHFRESQDESTAISDDSDSSEGDRSSIDIIVDAPGSPGSTKPRSRITTVALIGKSSPEELDSATAISGVSVRYADRPQLTIREDTEPPEADLASVQGLREHEVYFADWGMPSARSTGPARVRTVRLVDLPLTTDFSLVQSLIYGGSIETMLLSQSTSGIISASVTFTNADACENYHNSHPNGLAFKYKGRRYVTIVHKGIKVDVISGVMQSYLDCGATRVVKAIGVDDDWAMRALYRIAEGKNARRRVEAIIDSYRNESRDVIFRFTKIADAVAFRGELLRNADFADATIQFAEDPCEKAIGIH